MTVAHVLQTVDPKVSSCGSTKFGDLFSVYEFLEQQFDFGEIYAIDEFYIKSWCN